MAKRGLGRGLEALLPSNFSLQGEQGAGKAVKKVVELNIEEIVPNQEQPRRRFNDSTLRELAASIEEHGVVQPIIVRTLEDGKYQIVAGERRWRACQLLEKKTIPAIIENFNDQELLEIGLIENIQREDLNPLEEARAYKMLIDVYGLSQDEVAQKVGKSRPFIANMMRLLNLARPVQELLVSGELSVGHGRALLPLPEDGQVTLAKKVLREGLSVRETEALVKSVLTLAGDRPAKKEKKDRPLVLDKSLVLDYQDRLREKLGTKVEINQQGEKGKIIIEYYSSEELNRVLEFFFTEE
ncbi:MAG: ParB/RepB/Spo0J family partition protein [Clostridia bacterium]|nr:ParB/RepB/Spo0J family partition protein [Clostridia bacterium]